MKCDETMRFRKGLGEILPLDYYRGMTKKQCTGVDETEQGERETKRAKKEPTAPQPPHQDVSASKERGSDVQSRRPENSQGSGWSGRQFEQKSAR